ncbi:MAG TPA: hypothetical protein VEJ84_09190 [Acidimicrobiales bacterium]|nr:hypothetical protein [Acidimicrobiales bacterium]
MVAPARPLGPCNQPPTSLAWLASPREYCCLSVVEVVAQQSHPRYERLAAYSLGLDANAADDGWLES